ncbi:AAA family ATPase [Vibrio albus]
MANAEQFKELCFINGNSLLIDDTVWTVECCAELMEYFVENLDEGNGDFFEKLEAQLAKASAKAKVLAAEMLWLMFLCPSNIGPVSKRIGIERVFSWSGYQVEPRRKELYLSDKALTGVGSAGTAYNTLRWKELIYCIRLTESLLKLEPDDREQLLNEHVRFSEWLEQLPENNSRQLRHMILFLFFPDFHERIFGNTDRRAILAKCSNISGSQFNRMTSGEVDANLYELRTKLEEEYGTKELDFYVEPLKTLWKEDKLLKKSHIAEQEEIYQVEEKHPISSSLNQILYGPPGTGKTHATIDKSLQIVDPEFYVSNRANRSKLKVRFDELVSNNRIGFVTFHQSFSYEDFVEGLKATTEDKQISYEVEDGIFKRMCESASARPKLKSAQNQLDISGRTIWKMSLGEVAGEDSFIYQQCIENNYVLLGYGYDIDFSAASNRKDVVGIYRAEGVSIENESSEYKVNVVNRFKNEMVIGDLIIVSDGNRKFRAIAEITSDYFFDDSLVNSSGYSQVRNVIWHRVYEPSLPVEELFKKNLIQKTLYRLYDTTIDLSKLQTTLTDGNKSGSIGPGSQISSYQIEAITEELITLRKPNGSILPMPKVIVDELVELVKLNRITVDDIKKKRVFDIVNTTMEKHIVNGYQNVLSTLVQAVISSGILSSGGSSSTDSRVLIIDEINRGNISNIFGELITLIEPSKRSGGNEALSVKLPYSKDTFSVPSNLHIIGTMNTADKSLAQLDIALRRRFEFVEMMTDYNLLAEIPEIEGINVCLLVKTINQRIELLYDREHTIGHSFFIPLKDNPSVDLLAEIFELQILPLLEEYFFEDWERVGQVLGDHLKEQDEFCFVVEQFDSEKIVELMGVDWEAPGTLPYKRNLDALRVPEAYISVYTR